MRRTLLPTLVLMAACSAPPPVEPEPWASLEPVASACVEPPSAFDELPPASVEPEPSASVLPDLELPGTRPARAGEYGWSGVVHQSVGMHRVIENQCSPGTSRQTQLVFSVQNDQDDCFPASLTATGGEPAAVTVAGLDGLYVEGQTTSRNVVFSSLRGGETTGAYALPIGDHTLCVYLTWDRATTQDEVHALRQVVESIRGQQYGPDRIRVTFVLRAGWDTG